MNFRVESLVLQFDPWPSKIWPNTIYLAYISSCPSVIWEICFIFVMLEPSCFLAPSTVNTRRTASWASVHVDGQNSVWLSSFSSALSLQPNSNTSSHSNPFCLPLHFFSPKKLETFSYWKYMHFLVTYSSLFFSGYI